MRHSVTYTILFAGAVCVICAVLVSTSAVSLADRQRSNALQYKRKNVLIAAGLIVSTEKVTAEDINE